MTPFSFAPTFLRLASTTSGIAQPHKAVSVAQILDLTSPDGHKGHPYTKSLARWRFSPLLFMGDTLKIIIPTKNSLSKDI